MKKLDCIACGDVYPANELDNDGICQACNVEDLMEDAPEDDPEYEHSVYGFSDDDFGDDTPSDEMNDWEGDDWGDDEDW